MEAGNRIITCRNTVGDEIQLNEREFNPFILAKAEGIYDSNYNVQKTDYTIIDGAEYQGAVMSMRNIVLTIMDKDDFDTNRELIDQVFVKGDLGLLTVEDASHERCIEYYVESVTSTAKFDVRHTTISLLCPDPYFYDPDYQTTKLSNLVSDFEFIHEFTEDNEEFGHYSGEGLGTIMNVSSERNMGFTLLLKAVGPVVTPKITKVETQEFIQVGTEDEPFTMNYGDILTINTTTGKKNVYLNGESINQYLAPDSTFFQLGRGINTIGFVAEEGTDYITVKITYRYKYMRA